MNKKCVYVSIALLFLIFNSKAEILKDLEFANVNGHSLKLDIYKPEKAEAKTPLIVWIHGGGWAKGSKEKCSVKWMTEYGFSVASISYRLTDKAIFPAQIHDCKAAVRWLRANAEKYNLDTERFAVAGSSAGGMLAAMMGTTGGDEYCEGTVGGNLDQSSSVKAVIDFYGATDFILRSKTQYKRANSPGGIVSRLFGGGVEQKKELAKKASAVYYLDKNDPPFLVFHGDKDTSVLLDQSQAIEKAYKNMGLDIELVTLKGAGHGGKEFYSEENKKKMINFLKKNLQ